MRRSLHAALGLAALALAAVLSGCAGMEDHAYKPSPPDDATYTTGSRLPTLKGGDRKVSHVSQEEWENSRREGAGSPYIGGQ
jgi:hypothetical protein